SRQLDAPDSALRRRYVELRRIMLLCLREVRELNRSKLPDALWGARLQLLDDQAARIDAGFRQRLFGSVRTRYVDGLQTSSLMNDLGYFSRIIQSLRNVLLLSEVHELSRQLREVLPQEEAPLIQLR